MAKKPGEQESTRSLTTKVLITTVITVLVTVPLTQKINSCLERAREQLTYRAIAGSIEYYDWNIPILGVRFDRILQHAYYINISNGGDVPQEHITVRIDNLGEIALARTSPSAFLVSPEGDSMRDLKSFYGEREVAFELPRLPPNATISIWILTYPPATGDLPSLFVESASRQATRRRLDPKKAVDALNVIIQDGLQRQKTLPLEPLDWP